MFLKVGIPLLPRRNGRKRCSLQLWRRLLSGPLAQLPASMSTKAGMPASLPFRECRFGGSIPRPTCRKTGMKRSISAIREKLPTRAAFTPLAIAASYGRCGSSPASPRRKRPTNATSTSWRMAVADSQWPLICQRLWASTPAPRRARAKSASAASRLTHLRIWRSFSTASISKRPPSR